MKPIPSRLNRKYGYFRSPHKNLFAAHYARKSAEPLPTAVDLTPLCPPVYDQGQLGSCTANAIAGAYQFERMQAQMSALTPSRLFIYWNERSIEGDTQDDSGAFGGDGINSLETIGVCDETTWPYVEGEFASKPPPAAFTAAAPNKVLSRQIVTTLEEIKGALADRHLVPFGISLYQSFESDLVAQTGIVPDPAAGEGFIGGHEMCIAAYDDAASRFKVRNSWSSGWGIDGYCTMSYSYVLGAGSDFEVITKV